MKQTHKTGDTKFYSFLVKDSLRYVTDEYSREYRREDEKSKAHISHAGKCSILHRVSQSFDYPIDVLDLGCGTGRYFHCLDKLRWLVGVDVAPNMLTMAKDPVNGNDIQANIDLVCGSLFEVQFRKASFDLVYCIGVIGVFCPLDSFLLESVAGWLKPSGKFFFTAVDSISPRGATWKTMTAERVRHFLPSPLRRRIDVRLKTFSVSDKELTLQLDKSRFGKYEIERTHSDTGRIDLHILAQLR